MPYFSRDDIAQIGTPPGRAPLGALRLSGPGAFGILAAATEGLEDILSRRPERGCHPCRVRLDLRRFRDGGPLRVRLACPARAFLMPGPASYTREDVAELHLPGAPVLLQAALASLVRAGARPAAPGEFTFRAFRNGRLGLAQAEAVEAVIRADNDASLRRALARLGDGDRSRVEAWRDKAMHLAARVEAVLDFSGEEPDADLGADLAAMARTLAEEGLAADSRSLPDDGPPEAALVGRANAGKSSLFNALLGDAAALVAPTASTTRDSLRREVRWRGRSLLLSDNPGFHPAGAGAEGEAADKAARRLGGADLSCWVVDGSRPTGAEDAAFARRLSGRVVLVVNKADLPERADLGRLEELAAENGLAPAARVRVSAATGEGVDRLREFLADAAPSLAGSGRWNRRELLELAAAADCCRRAGRELAGAGRLELAAEELREAAGAFSRALGDGYAEEALSRIFSQFCIGK